MLCSDYTKWLKYKANAQLLDSDKISGIPVSSRHSNISKIPQPWYNGIIGLFAKIIRILTPVAGTGEAGSSGEGGPALYAQLDRPRGLGLDPSKENLYIAVSPNDGGGRILKMNFKTRIVTRIAGDPTKLLSTYNAFSGTGVITSVSGNATSVTYTLVPDIPIGPPPASQAIVKHSFLPGQSVRITGMPAGNEHLNITGVVTTITNTTLTLDRSGGSVETLNLIPSAGDKTPASIGTLAVNAGIVNPYNVVTDSNGNIYFANQHFSSTCIFKVDTDGYISRYCGPVFSGTTGENVHRLDTTMRLHGPRGIAIDSNDNIYFGDVDTRFTVRKIDAVTNLVTTIIGTANQQAGISPTNTYPTNGALGTSVRLRAPTALAINSTGSDMYILDFNGGIGGLNGIYRYNFGEGKVYVILQAVNGSSGDGGSSINARITNPRGIEFDQFDNLYISDTSNGIRKIDKDGIITRYTGEYSYDIAWHIAVRTPDEIYSCDLSNKVVLAVPTTTYR